MSAARRFSPTTSAMTGRGEHVGEAGLPDRLDAPCAGRFPEARLDSAFFSDEIVGWLDLLRLSSVLAHNLNRELQIHTEQRNRQTTRTRAALWIFRKAGTLVRLLVQHAGRITSPCGEFTVTTAANPIAQKDLVRMARRLIEAEAA